MKAGNSTLNSSPVLFFMTTEHWGRMYKHMVVTVQCHGTLGDPARAVHGYLIPDEQLKVPVFQYSNHYLVLHCEYHPLGVCKLV